MAQEDYLMQARSSETGELVTWPRATPDWAGAYFPGPGTPTEIAIAAMPDLLGADPVPDDDSAISAGIYGDGSDMSAAFNGTSMEPMATRTSFEYVLNRDCYFHDITIGAAYSVNTNGFKLFANGTVTNAGTIHRNGNHAVGAVAGAALAGGTLGISGAGGTPGVDFGYAPALSGYVISDVNNAGGAGGNPSGGSSRGGGTTLTAAMGSLHSVPNAVLGCAISGTSGVTPVNGGGGGGAGGGSAPGAGGGGAGVMVLAFYDLNNTGGRIYATGGDGGNAASGNSGGGGGGSGGLIILITRICTGLVRFPARGAVGISNYGGLGGTKTGTGTNGTTMGAGYAPIVLTY